MKFRNDSDDLYLTDTHIGQAQFGKIFNNKPKHNTYQGDLLNRLANQRNYSNTHSSNFLPNIPNCSVEALEEFHYKDVLKIKEAVGACGEPAEPMA